MPRKGSGGPSLAALGIVSIALAASVLSPACAPAPSPDLPRREVPRRGGTLRFVEEEPASLDPRAATSVYESLPINQIFDTLVTIDPSLTVQPGLAETWRISRDGTEFIFTLRGGVSFHDGLPLTARDVVFSICRQLGGPDGLISLASSYLMVIDGAAEFSSGAAPDVRGLDILDERTLRIRLAQPYVAFLEVLTMDNLGVVPEHDVLARGAAAFARAPVGTGPFRFVGWTAGESMLLAANPAHFRGRPYLDAVEISFLRSSDTDLGAARFVGGEVDVFEPPAEVLDALASDPTVQLLRHQMLSLSFLGLNTGQPPLDRPWLRRAVAHAIDRDALVRESPAVRRAAVGILPPGVPGYSPEPKALAYDPEEARRLLAAAGHAGGAGLPPIRLENPSRTATAERVIERLRADLAGIGLELEVVPVSWAELSARLEARTSPAFLLGWVADLTDPDSFLRSLFESGGSGNYFGHRSAETERLLDLGKPERNPEQRARIYRQLERQVLQDAPIVPLYHSVGVIATRTRVHGLDPSPLGLAKVDLERVWFAAAGPRS